MNKKQSKYIVHGFVQGVGFRYFVYEIANSLHLTGYAKNNYDGTVEIVAEGEEKDLATLFDNLKIGPSRAAVLKVERKIGEFTGKFKRFDIF